MTDWTEEATELLKSLWATHSARQIADEIALAGLGDFSRCAVQSRAHRLGLCEKRPETTTSAFHRPPRARVSAAHQVGGDASKILHAIKRQRNGAPKLKPEFFVCQQLPDITPRNIGLLDLAHDDCRWPTSENLPHTFCALPKLEGSSYCAAHARLSFGLGTTAERIAHKRPEKAA